MAPEIAVPARAGSGTQAMSVATATVTGVPVIVSVPTINGTAQVGNTLTGTHGTWTNSPTSDAEQWYRAGTAISGATTLTNTPRTADVGSTLTLGEIATNASGSSAQAMSAPTSAVTTASAIYLGTTAIGSSNDGNSYNTALKASMLSIWQSIATTYATNTAVAGYDLWNEPLVGDGSNSRTIRIPGPPMPSH